MAALGLFPLFLLSIFGVTFTVPCDGARVYQKEHCLKMTPSRESEIETIVQKIGHFLNDLAIHHEEFDVRLTRIDIEKHSPLEKEEKDTQIQIYINDCHEEDITVSNDDYKRKEDNGSTENEQRLNCNENANSDNGNTAKDNENTNDDGNTKIETGKDVSTEIVSPPTQVFEWNVPENGEELIREVERVRGKKSPLLVYVQEESGGRTRMFTLFN